MKTLKEHLSDFGELVGKNCNPEMNLEEFTTDARRIMGEMWSLSGTKRTMTKFLDADFMLTRSIVEYEEKPDPAAFGRIKNAFVRYKTEATRSHQEAA